MWNTILLVPESHYPSAQATYSITLLSHLHETKPASTVQSQSTTEFPHHLDIPNLAAIQFGNHQTALAPQHQYQKLEQFAPVYLDIVLFSRVQFWHSHLMTYSAFQPFALATML